MKRRMRLGVVGAALAVAIAGIGPSWAQDANTTIAQRQDPMKPRGRHGRGQGLSRREERTRRGAGRPAPNW